MENVLTVNGKKDQGLHFPLVKKIIAINFISFSQYSVKPLLRIRLNRLPLSSIAIQLSMIENVII
jgi:hypothetical protein